MAQQTARGQSFYDLQALVYELTPQERAYCEEYVPEHDRTRFKLAVIGLKITDLQTCLENGNGRTLREWVHWDEDTKDELADVALEVPDPRLNPQNFEFQQPEMRIMAEISNELLKRAWLFYVFGRRVQDPSMRYATPDDIQEAYERFSRRIGGEVHRTTQIGKKFYDKYQELEKKQREHKYNSGKATANDIEHSRANAEALGLGNGEWIYERTVFANRHVEDFERVVHLFVNIDSDNNISNRIAVKIQGDEELSLLRRDIRQEFENQRLVSIQNCPHILKAFGSSIRVREVKPHLGYGFLEYAPFGDLVSFVHNFKALNPNSSQIPEPFIWMVFRGLAEALHVMYTGHAVTEEPTPGSQHYDTLEKMPGWNSMVHTDIKPANVVLGHSGDKWPAFKTPKLIDFGLAFRGNMYPNAISKDGTGFGTPGFRPPEMERLGEDQGSQRLYDMPINHTTDIFNVGLIIYSLMECCVFFFTRDVAIRYSRHHFTYNGVYSHSLETLARQCTELDPARRPKIKELMYKTKKGLEEWERAYVPVDARSDNLPDFARTQLRDEVFKIGEKAPTVWNDRRATVKRRRAEEDDRPNAPRHQSPKQPRDKNTEPGQDKSQGQALQERPSKRSKTGTGAQIQPPRAAVQHHHQRPQEGPVPNPGGAAGHAPGAPARYANPYLPYASPPPPPPPPPPAPEGQIPPPPPPPPPPPSAPAPAPEPEPVLPTTAPLDPNAAQPNGAPWASLPDFNANAAGYFPARQLPRYHNNADAPLGDAGDDDGALLYDAAAAAVYQAQIQAQTQPQAQGSARQQQQQQQHPVPPAQPDLTGLPRMDPGVSVGGGGGGGDGAAGGRPPTPADAAAPGPAPAAPNRRRTRRNRGGR